ncbi:MAG: hypothetical protein ABIW76_10485 [Fibrobacteria bacterium]
MAEPEPEVIQAAPFKITISTGGGFAGSVSGCTLGSDGLVVYWDKRGLAPESIRWKVVAGRSPILEFRRLLETGGALNMTLRETGNMTTEVNLELPDTLRIWSWPGNGPSETTPEPFRTWYSQVEAFCQSLSPARTKPTAPLDSAIAKPHAEPDGK